MSHDVQDADAAIAARMAAVAAPGIADGPEERERLGTLTGARWFAGPVSQDAVWRRLTVQRWAAGLAAACRDRSPFGARAERVVLLDGCSVVAALDRAGGLGWGAGALTPLGTAVGMEFTPGPTFAYDTRAAMAKKAGRGSMLLQADGLPALRP